MFKQIAIIISFIFCFAKTQAAEKTKPILYIYENEHKNSKIEDIITNHVFEQYPSNLLNLGLGNKDYWIKTTIPDLLKQSPDLILLVDQSRLLFVDVVYIKNKKVVFTQHHKSYNLVSNINLTGNVNYFKIPKKIIDLNPDIFIHILSNELFVVPIILQSERDTNELMLNRGLIFGLYSGALLIMFLYNLFLYFTVKDRSYLFYVFYILFTWLAQISVQGFASKYLWSDNLWIHQHCVTIISLIALLFGLYFTTSFLNTKVLVKKYHQIFQGIIVLAVINLLLSLTSYFYIAFAAMQFLTILSCLIALWIASIVYFKKKFKPAGYYLLAWTTLIIGIILFVAKDYGIIPYNYITVYILQIASIIEVTLLSFALADKINMFKKEKEESQAEALKILTENEKLIREQHMMLELKVKERTEDLQRTNQTLSLTLSDLKEAQSQLVDQEKMAGLGQLTAGIAHEINNPINFVTSNIKPLELDINDLDSIINMYEKLDLTQDLQPQISKIEAFKKQIDLLYVRDEIKSLLSGIGDGARRTAEIIRSLKNFSRLDENDTKEVNLNEGLDSTLVLIRSTFPSNLKIVKDYEAIPDVECMAGKINQVFMNLISNAIYAIKSKPLQSEEETLTIKTWQEDRNVKISIKDSGTGMPEEVKQKIFEPFFTTKDVGEGTGLGLSIVFRIIESHHGNIDVSSKINEGTEFIITLPINNK